MINPLKYASRSLGAKFGLFIGGLLLPLFVLTGAVILVIQDNTFTEMGKAFETTFTVIRDSNIETAKKEDEAKIDKLGKLLAAIAPAAIASYDFTSLVKYAQTAVETPGVCMISYKTPEGQEMASAKSKDGASSCGTRAFVIESEGTKMGEVVVGFHDLLVQKKVADMDAEFGERKAFLAGVQNHAVWSIGLLIAGSLFGVAVLTLGAVLFLFRAFVARPIHASVAHMKALAEGRLDIEIGYTERQDEIGSIAKALEIFKRNAQEREELRRHEQERDRLAKEKAEKITRLSAAFDQNVGQIVGAVAAAAAEVQTNATGLTDMSARTSSLSSSVASATTEASANVQTVASATEELTASIGEINRQVVESAQMAQSAVAEVQRTDRTVSSMSEATDQIGDVIKLIQDIAEQTNLLALNATIEAARAGDAGKGFAVVAGEVKNLANQTAHATEDISKKIVMIQNVSTEAAEAIRGIGKIIEKINTISTSVTTAVEQQNAATREIARNVSEASSRTHQVSTSISSVAEAAGASQKSSRELLSSADDLSKRAETLRKEIQTFLEGIRAQ